jgi:hypothetical protein
MGVRRKREEIKRWVRGGGLGLEGGKRERL